MAQFAAAEIRYASSVRRCLEERSSSVQTENCVKFKEKYACYWNWAYNILWTALNNVLLDKCST